MTWINNDTPTTLSGNLARHSHNTKRGITLWNHSSSKISIFKKKNSTVGSSFDFEMILPLHYPQRVPHGFIDVVASSQNTNQSNDEKLSSWSLNKYPLHIMKRYNNKKKINHCHFYWQIHRCLPTQKATTRMKTKI